MRQNLYNNRYGFCAITIVFALFVQLAGSQLALATPMRAAQFQDDDSKTVELSKALRRKLDQIVIPALEADDDDYFLEVVTPIFDSGNSDVFAAIEDYCNQNGLASIQSRYVDLKIRLIEEGHIAQGRKIKLGVAALIAAELNSRVELILDETDDLKLLQDPLVTPSDWQLGEKFYWEIHVSQNQLSTAHRMLGYATDVLTPYFKKVQRSGDVDMITVFDDVEQFTNRLYETHQDMMEREAESRLSRLALSHRVLTNPEMTFENQLQAAMALEIDGPLLIEFLQKYERGSLARPSLADTPGLVDDVTKRMQQARNANPDVIKKAGLFRNGLHYWYRGRYGSAQMFYGYLKSPTAMDSLAAMEGLYMPKERPVPVIPSYDNDDVENGFERRHHYTWAAEYREMKTVSGSSDETSRTWLTMEKKPTVKTRTRFY